MKNFLKNNNKKRKEGDKKLKNKLNLKKDVWINFLLIFKY